MLFWLGIIILISYVLIGLKVSIRPSRPSPQRLHMIA